MTEIIDWLSGLDPVFAFMLALPFAVGIAGLAVEYCRSRRRMQSTGAKKREGHRFSLDFARGGDS